MSQNDFARRRLLLYLALGVLLLAISLLITAASESPAQAPEPSPSAEEPVYIEASLEDAGEASFEDIPLEESAQTGSALPAPDDTSAPDATEQTAQEEAPEWNYETSTITVHIGRHQQDNFVYYAADIQLTDPSQFSYAFANERFDAGTEALSDIAERNNPLLAINGDYCGFHNNGVIIRGGELFRKQNSARQMLIVDKNGDLSVLVDRSEKQGVVADRLMEEGVLHTFEFGPTLVENGQAVEMDSAIVRVEDGYLEPRTAIGQLGPLHYLVIVVDGRSEGYSEGCDLPTLQQLFLDHGAQIAFNLDGGGSTTLWFNGKVINHPASGEERKVSDIVMFMR